MNWEAWILTQKWLLQRTAHGNDGKRRRIFEAVGHCRLRCGKPKSNIIRKLNVCESLWLLLEALVFTQSSEAKAEAARGESFEQTRDQISALSLKVSEISATLLKLSVVQQPAELVSEHGDGNSPEQVEDVIAEPTAAREDVEPGLRAIRQLLPPPSVENDPQKGRFGGSASNDKRSLVATVVQSDLGRKWFSVTVRLQSNDGGPLTGKYAFFFLHDTFEPDTYRVRIPPGALSVDFKTTSKGAFTIGVVADKGTTFLELDLASDAVSAPQSFKDY